MDTAANTGGPTTIVDDILEELAGQHLEAWVTRSTGLLRAVRIALAEGLDIEAGVDALVVLELLEELALHRHRGARGEAV